MSQDRAYLLDYFKGLDPKDFEYEYVRNQLYPEKYGEYRIIDLKNLLRSAKQNKEGLLRELAAANQPISDIQKEMTELSSKMHQNLLAGN